MDFVFYSPHQINRLRILKPFLLCLMLLAGRSTICPAQDYAYKHYDIKDGLVGNHVYQVVQDRDGFLWFATETGVSRYDGSRFKNFTTADGLPDNEIIRLFADSRGRVWIAPFQNAICYYYKGKIYNRHNDSLVSRIKLAHPPREIIEDKAHNLLILDDAGIAVVHADGRTSRVEEYEKGPMAVNTGGIDSEGNPFVIGSVYIGDKNFYSALKVQIGAHPQAVLWQIQGARGLPASVEMRYYFATPRGFLFPLKDYLGGEKPQHLQYWNSIDNTRDTIAVPNGLNIISYGNNDCLYFNTFNGVKVYDLRSRRFVADFLESENVSYCIDDNEGNKWFATLGKGVYMISPDIKRARLSESKEYITSLNGMNGLVFAGVNANNRIFKLDAATGQYQNSRYLQPGQDGKVVAIEKQHNEFYFLSTRGFYKCDTSFKQFEPSILNSMAYTFKDIAVVGRDSFAFATHSYTFSQPFNGLPHRIFNGRSTAVCYAFGGTFIGTLYGLHFVGPDGQSQYLGATQPLLATRITSLLYAGGRLWVGTNDNGVVCYNGLKAVRKIAESEGLTGNIVRALYVHGDYLWVGTDRGLNKISIADTSLPILTRYTAADGLASDMVNAIYVADTMVYVGTPDGLSFFDETKAAQKSRCDLRLLGITVSGTDRAFEGGALQLKSRENNIRVEFVAISYKSAGDITYRYRLLGIDDEWKTTRDNFLQYPALPSGSYELQLVAVNKFGVKSEELRIPFVIAKKILEETWFRVLLLLLAIGIVWGVASWRIRRIRQRYREKMATNSRIAALEQQALKAQMNPHFIFNCLNSIQQYVIDKDVMGANRFITGFSRLVRQTLENSSKQMITVGEEAAFLNAYLMLEQMRFEGRFEYRVTVADNINKDEVYLPPMLLQPYVENSIRHGIKLKQNGKGQVDINISLASNRLFCTVVDNGVGREVAQRYKSSQHIEYQSRGMLLTSQRIALFNIGAKEDIALVVEDLKDGNGAGIGTKVTVSLPAHN
jgi:ligand-binding sensor domain-containing protein